MIRKNSSQKTKWILLCLLISVLLCGFSVLFLYSSYQSKKQIDELNKTIEEQNRVITELQQGKLKTEENIVANTTPEISNEPLAINVNEWSAGTEIPSESIDFANLRQYFQGYEISGEVFVRINGKSYRENNDVGLGDLRYLKVLHYDFESKIKVGELIVDADLVEDFLYIFMRLFEAEYQIQSMFLVDNYWTGDPDTTDSESIDYNNTSAFNYRMATGSETLSQHAFGRAIDINPQQNPYVSYKSGNAKWSHENANGYIDRTTGADHMITENDLCYQLFIEQGFEWGGNWEYIKDYQHFEKK